MGRRGEHGGLADTRFSADIKSAITARMTFLGNSNARMAPLSRWADGRGHEALS